MKQRTRVLRRAAIRLCLIGACLAAQPIHAALHVQLDSSPLGGGVFQYELSVANTGSEDVAIVSVIDAPTSDALISSTLQAPDGFNAIYDPGVGLSFGFIDLLEDTALFAAGATTSGFQFQSEATPPENFTLFEAITVGGNILSGSIAFRNVPDTTSTVLMIGLSSLILFSCKQKYSLLKN